MRVHVTGGSGFLGRYVVALLLQRGHAVTALARSADAEARLRAGGAEPVAGDLNDPGSIDAAFGSCDAEVLVNLASLGFGHAPTIVAAAEEAGLERAVFVSTTAIFTKLNASSKAVRVAAEEAVRASRLRWTIIRPTMIYGSSDDRNMARFLRLLRRAPLIPVPGHGYTLQQPVHVADLASVVVTAAERHETAGHAYNVAGPDALSFRDVVAQAGAAVSRAPRVLPLPAGLIVRALHAVERTGHYLPIKAEQIERLTEDKVFDIEPARRDLGFAPRPFAIGIAEEVNGPATAASSGSRNSQ